jgi:hypothetical protein
MNLLEHFTLPDTGPRRVREASLADEWRVDYSCKDFPGVYALRLLSEVQVEDGSAANIDQNMAA